MGNDISGQWQFWIDRGGTFTDVVALHPDGSHSIHKVLSDHPEQRDDAAIRAIRTLLQTTAGEPIPEDTISAVKMGTTVATNALLERQGTPTVLVINQGMGDSLIIGDQTRPDLFARHIVRPAPVAQHIVEVTARMDAQGTVLADVDQSAVESALREAYEHGGRSVAVALMHGYRYPEHERMIGAIARTVGFHQVSLSHEVSPTIKLIPRADTTVVDAFLSPVLRRYVDSVTTALPQTPVWFMQSSGGLTHASHFQGRNSILSGPAGGVVGAVRTSQAAGFDRIIGFDMGGTSTDVFHFAGEYERTFETTVAGARLRTPMMALHTVAAGGGSMCHFDGLRFVVGPDSAGANPGPICYRNGGPLTITDCNLALGRLHPAHFPKAFGPKGNQAIDAAPVNEALSELASEITHATGQPTTAEHVAAGFLEVAVETMARAIRRISIERGHDVRGYTLCCYGGAGGQHACRVADALGIGRVLIHPAAGVLSALGMGLATQSTLREQSIRTPLSAEGLGTTQPLLAELTIDAIAELAAQDIGEPTVRQTLLIRMEGTDTALALPRGDLDALEEGFHQQHQRRFGFRPTHATLIIEAIRVEATGPAPPLIPCTPSAGDHGADTVPMAVGGEWTTVPLRVRADLAPKEAILGPALITDDTGTTVVEPGWQAVHTAPGDLILERVSARSKQAVGTDVDPIRLSVFNHRFMAIAEHMGITLEHTSHSVNIKERRDYSCALFDGQGRLVANAPHIPVHLGSMGESVQAMARKFAGAMQPGDAYLVNDPYGGGTHLPDLTVVTPVFLDEKEEPSFYVASRGHHADVGGTTPGSMPPDSTTIEDEGVLFSGFPLVTDGAFHEAALRERLSSDPYPARNPDQNVADLRAQIAANARGVEEIATLTDEFGLDTVSAYMRHVYDNAAEAVRRQIVQLQNGSFRCAMDDGCAIEVAVTIDNEKRCAAVNFEGTSPQQTTNINAPQSICRAVVLTVFRTLVDQDIPLNAGCLEPISIVIPAGSMLDPTYPAAVVAGNVETSQIIADALFGALGAMAASQGTMNNLTFGNQTHQYYETLCGGTGAGPDFDGTDAVHSNMTNSRLTDPEILEDRYPVRVEALAIRPDSGGAGRHRGGHGTIRRIRFLEAMDVSILSGRRSTAPHGLFGGEAGQSGRNQVVRADGQVESLGGRATTTMNPGDTLVVETPGGGGYGPTKPE